MIPPNEWLKNTSSKLKKYNDYRESDHKAMYQDEFGRLAEKYGRPLAEVGIDACLVDKNRPNFGFKPLPEEFEDYVMSARDKKGIRYGAANPNCHFCHGDGWMTDPRKPGYVTKCDCRRLA